MAVRSYARRAARVRAALLAYDRAVQPFLPETRWAKTTTLSL
ncbi:hypothetical protein GA0115241_1100112 [Streptomyces sp. DpondAA-D4]|nr:hypothetical protein YUMDRAFT_03691 [Streptomyces sp. OspMP-M45]SCD34930.1 hypothetical protein GA0115249_101698 [Streptomyces sp. PpalLS-921]SCE10993.1 hypothetical protein GA0115241_1100112 [Streptomyces sp. DpondAA-D4]